MSSSPECSQLPLTAEQLRTSVILNSISELQNWQSLLALMETGLSPGESFSGQPSSSFHTENGNSKSIPNTSHHILPPFTQARTGKSLSSIKPSGNESDPSTTSHLMNSANSDISKPATSMDMALVKAANPPSRKRPRNLELEPTGDRRIHADYGMKENVTRKCPHVSTDTFVNSAEAHTSRETASVARSEALKW